MKKALLILIPSQGYWFLENFPKRRTLGPGIRVLRAVSTFAESEDAAEEE